MTEFEQRRRYQVEGEDDEKEGLKGITLFKETGNRVDALGGIWGNVRGWTRNPL